MQNNTVTTSHLTSVIPSPCVGISNSFDVQSWPLIWTGHDLSHAQHCTHIQCAQAWKQRWRHVSAFSGDLWPLPDSNTHTHTHTHTHEQMQSSITIWVTYMWPLWAEDGHQLSSILHSVSASDRPVALTRHTPHRCKPSTVKNTLSVVTPAPPHFTCCHLSPSFRLSFPLHSSRSTVNRPLCALEDLT